MSVRVLTASSQALNNGTLAVIPTYPFSVGVWFFPTAVSADQTIWSFSDTATTNNYYLFRIAAAGNYEIAARGGSTESAVATSLMASTGSYKFVVCRFISATNRRLTVRNNDNALEEIQDTTNRTASGLDNARLGGLLTTSALEFAAGYIAEWWWTNTDIQPGGAALETALFQQLAFFGPLSVPHIACNLMEYRSLRQSLDQTTETIDDPCISVGGRQPWTNVGSATLDMHPYVVSSGYVLPNTIKSNLIV